MPFAWRRATLSGAAALVGAIATASTGLFLGMLVGAGLGLPRSNLISDAADEGFDQLDLGLWVSLVGWIVGALAASRAIHRRLGGPPLPRVSVAAAAMALLGVSMTLVGSGTADWYDPLVVFGAPVVAMGVRSGRERPGKHEPPG